MASAKKKAKRLKAASKMEAAVDYFASRSHDAWRRAFHTTNPDQKAEPRMRMRGGEMVDVNQPWSKLHPAAKADNLRAAQDAYAAVKAFPKDREAAADAVHKAWIKANKGDPNQSKELFKSYSKLPEVEKDKDRAHVDAMKAAIVAVSKETKKAAKPPEKGRLVSVQIDAAAWGRLEAAAKALSKAVGRDVSAETLATAGAEAMSTVAKALAAESRTKRA